jgi:hypothetical protein
MNMGRRECTLKMSKKKEAINIYRMSISVYLESVCQITQGPHHVVLPVELDNDHYKDLLPVAGQDRQHMLQIFPLQSSTI